MSEIIVPKNKSWTKEKIEDFLQKEVLHYQNIKLPFGLSTPGTNRQQTCDRIFGEDIRGKTVLDVGCSIGYFCIEALNRGARRAVGWDLDAESIRHARIIADMLDLPAEYNQRNVEEVIPQEVFDVVICLNVLHHVVDPIAVLDKLVKLTRKTLVLELASLGHRDRRKLGYSAVLSWVLKKTPVIVVGGESREHRFSFTRSSIENLLKFHRYHFSKIDVLDSEFKDRFVIIANRLRVGHLIIVSGLTTADTSTLTRELNTNRVPELARCLGIRNFTERELIDSSTMDPSSLVDREQLVLLYDLLQPYRQGARIYDRDKVLHLLEGASEISFVTIWSSPQRLELQIHEKYQHSKPKKRDRALLKICRQPIQIINLYRRWFEFCEKQGSKTRTHCIVELGDKLKFYSRPEWENMVRIYGE